MELSTNIKKYILLSCTVTKVFESSGDFFFKNKRSWFIVFLWKNYKIKQTHKLIKK